MNATKVVISTATPRASDRGPVPGSLLVSVDLGYSFHALPPEVQLRIVESRLADALALATAKLDEMNAEPASAERVA